MQPQRTIVARCLLGILLLAGGLYCFIPSPLTPPLLTAELRQEAESKFRQMYQREPDHFDVVSIAAIRMPCMHPSLAPSRGRTQSSHSEEDHGAERRQGHRQGSKPCV